MVDNTRNSAVLASFVAYCKANPDMRFWQALRNWSKYSFILVSSEPPADDSNMKDTFYWEGASDVAKDPTTGIT